MWNFLRGGATVIPGGTFIPESRVRNRTGRWNGNLKGIDETSLKLRPRQFKISSDT